MNHPLTLCNKKRNLPKKGCVLRRYEAKTDVAPLKQRTLKSSFATKLKEKSGVDMTDNEIQDNLL